VPVGQGGLSADAASGRAAWRGTTWQHVTLASYWFALNFETAALLTITLPAVVARLAPRGHTGVLARLEAAAAVVAMAVPPLVGALSDRWRARGTVGRHAVVVAGAGLSTFGLLGMARAATLPGLTLAFLVAMVGQNGSLAAYEALLPEVVPPEGRGTASGYMGAATLLGTLGGLGVAGLTGPGWTYAATGVLLLSGAAWTAWGVPEPAAAPTDAAPVARLPADPDAWRDFRTAFAARFLVMLGLSLLMTFVFYFFGDVLRVAQPSRATAGMAGLALLGAVAASLFVGRWSDRAERRLVVAWSTVPMAAAAAGFAFVARAAWVPPFALLFGAGYGAYLAVDWALGIDTLPARSRVARDLGIWGISTNLPSVVAPVLGAWLLASQATPALGYRVLFLASAASFALGAVVVLGVGARPLSPWAAVPLLLAVAAALAAYGHLVARVRWWGRLPRRRGATLVVANHQHDLDGLLLPAILYLGGPWRHPVYSAASSRMFERGFLATQVPAVLRPLLWRVRLGGVLPLFGCLPLENEPRRRPLASWAEAVRARHGELRLGQVFDPAVLETLGIPEDAPLGALWRAELAPQALRPVSFLALREPYRREARQGLAERLEAQIRRLEDGLRRGATLYLTPEGVMTRDGSMGRLREALRRARAQGAATWVAAVSYDPLAAGRRLGVLVRLRPVPEGTDLGAFLRASRPVTLSQLLARWALGRGGAPFCAEEAARGVAELVRGLPPEAWVDPELRRDPEVAVRRALAALIRRRLLLADDVGLRLPETRRDPRFPRVPDIWAYQARMLEETLAALPAAGYSRPAS
jgi:MFS family permease